MMNEGFAAIGFTLAAMAFFALTLMPIVLRSTSNSMTVVLLLASLLPTAVSLAYYLSYSPARGGAHTLIPTIWATTPILVALILRAIFKALPTLKSSVRWKMLALILIVFPVILVGGMMAYGLFTWSGW